MTLNLPLKYFTNFKTNKMIKLLVFIIVFGTLYVMLLISVGLHELGHYWKLKKNGIEVEEVSLLGIGPKLWSKEYNGTLFSIRLFPIAGYTRPVDLDQLEELSLDSLYDSVAVGPMANVFLASLGLLVVDSQNLWAYVGLGACVLFYFTKYLIPVLSIVLGILFYYAEITLWGQDANLLDIYLYEISIDTITDINGIILIFASLNLFLFIFNLLPFAITDGGRMVSKLFEEKFPALSNAYTIIGISSLIYVFIFGTKLF